MHWLAGVAAGVAVAAVFEEVAAEGERRFVEAAEVGVRAAAVWPGARRRCRDRAAVAEAGRRLTFPAAVVKEWGDFRRPAAGRVADRSHDPGAAVVQAAGRLRGRAVAVRNLVEVASQAVVHRSETSTTS
jgi:hypothetical protein